MIRTPLHPDAILGAGCTERSRRGFTLLEMCIVLLIIALLLSVTMPAFQSAWTERAVRNDTHEISMMIKTAMIQVAEQHRPYVIDLKKDTVALHPLGLAAKDPSDADTQALFQNEDTPTATTGDTDVTATQAIDKDNKLQLPDPALPGKWEDIPDGTQWVFQPGELCPATSIRLERGDAYIELYFNALTGNVDKENTYFP
jgi:prepilin-type N-terminal cleavage/methylation domain-containing protein